MRRRLFNFKDMKIKKGDKIIVIAGSDKGKEGVVIKAIPSLNKIVAEGICMRKRHRRPTKQGEKGKLVEVAMPINVSNVKLAGAVKATKTVKPAKKVSAAKKK